MKEGSLEAPTRHAIDWQDPDFTDMAKIEAEMHRVFDICHGCRRCFNLCDSFPRLFDLVDNSPTGELDAVAPTDYKRVVDACTLCDMCFMTKCPYVPPHAFNLDFPHLMLRYRAAELKAGRTSAIQRELVKTDRNGKLGGAVAPLANWAVDSKNKLTRPVMEKIAGIDREAALPKFHGKTFAMRARREAPEVNAKAPGFGRKAVIYATCFVNYNNPQIGIAARAVLARNGVETEVVYPACCGMPQLERGDVAAVAASARKVAAALKSWIERGADVKALSRATYDCSEYIVDIAKKAGLAEGLTSLSGGVTVHIACHARAQNMGQKAAEMLRLLPTTDVTVIERCSGHGGSWGVEKGNFDVALKIGRPVAKQAVKNASAFVASECPLAGMHILQGMDRIEGETPDIPYAHHPIELFARAYGIALA